MITTPIHKSRPPLRWLANGFNHIDSYFLMKAIWLDEDGKVDTFAFKFNAKMYKIFTWPYMRWGTTYQIDIEEIRDQFGNMKTTGWDDYDENGIPYWYWDWNEDSFTGDAWRLIKK